MKKPTHIYYHMDFDGLVSSSLAYHFFKGRGFLPQIERPVDFDIKSPWEERRIRVRKPFAIVDFLYRNDAFAYFDHHGPNKPQKLSPETEYFFFDKNAKSCASLIFRNLGEINHTEELSKIVQWCDIIDTASYAQHNLSVQDQLYPKEQAIILSKALETARIEGEENFWNSLSERLIKNPSIENLCQDREVLEKYKTCMKNQEEALSLLSRISQYDKSTGIVTYDATNGVWSRFGLASIYPDSLVWIGLRKTNNNLVYLGVCPNPWNPKSREALKKINVGKFLSKYNGSGHKSIGGAHFKSHKKATESICEIKKHLVTFI
jgi:hypothetical protein